MRKFGVTPALAAGVAAVLAAGPAHAGGAIGWANAVTQFSTEGQAVGAAAVVLGIVAIGAVLFFGLSGLVGTVIMACLGGALMANSQQVASIFGGGGGGGSIRHVHAAPPTPASGLRERGESRADARTGGALTPLPAFPSR